MTNLTRYHDLGQVWTPQSIAVKMARVGIKSLPAGKKIKVLDPAVGPFTFPKAFIDAGLCERISQFVMFDVDTRMVEMSSNCCKDHKKWRVTQKDYIKDERKDRFDLVIMNPPYVRHEKISKEEKDFYISKIRQIYGETIDRRSNLFIFFLLKALSDVRPEGVVCAIVYDAILSSQYGKSALELMNRYSTVISSEHISEPFGDALIDAQIMIWKKNSPGAKNVVQLSTKTVESDNAGKVVKLSSLMQIKRGFAIPYRKAFIVPQNTVVPFETKEILIKQKDPDVFTCKNFSRIVYDTNDDRARKFLIDRLEPQQDSTKVHITKSDWRGDICFNYYLRGKPRHLLNTCGCLISDNFYVAKVLNGFPVKAAWVLLNSDLYIDAIMSSGRNQGDGLVKLQAYEYKAVRVPNWNNLTHEQVTRLTNMADDLLESKPTYDAFRRMASMAAEEVFG